MSEARHRRKAVDHVVAQSAVVARKWKTNLLKQMGELL